MSLSPTIRVCAASTSSCARAYSKIAGSGLTAPTSNERTNSSTQTSQPRSANAGRMSKAMLLKTAVRMPFSDSDFRTSPVSGYGDH
ncbi:hypothetical protein AN948_31165 [Rhodococcus sp. ADH]|nr:hypothetical protein AN948_31165 [Rhodococcus sp. ADH]